MQVQLEVLERLGRRLRFTVPQSDVQQAVDVILKRIARTAKIAGFRPGKAPLKIVLQHYGHAAHDEALTELRQKYFSEAVRNQKLRITAQPYFEDTQQEKDGVTFTARFEVFPEIKSIDPSALQVEKLTLTVSDVEVDKTIEILRNQRVRYEPVDRQSEPTDQITVDFNGEIDGVVIPGGHAQDYTFVLGAGQMLPEFEAAATGVKAGEEKAFALTFPEDYHGKDVAGKTAHFTLTVKKVAAAVLPEVDAEFAKSLGAAEGGIEQMRAEIHKNLEREVRFRLRAQTAKNVIDALMAAAPIELPASLVTAELQNVLQSTLESLKSRGLDAANVPFPADIGEKMQQEAANRVHRALVLNDFVHTNQLTAKPEQIKAIVDDLAESYEQPAEIVKWYYESQERLSGPQHMAVEDNVVAYVLSKAKVVETAVSFESLMEKK